jgi:proline iminopeptidase
MLLLLLLAAVFFACKKEEIKVGELNQKTVVEDSSLPSYRLADGTLLHLESFGDPSNPVLFVLHGGPGNSYKPYLPWKALSDDYFMVFWDQRGAGLSERVPNDELNGPQYLKDLHEIGNYFSPNEPFYLIGHSWGGAYAAYYVKHYPNRVEKLVLIEPGPMNKAAMENVTAANVEFFNKELQAFLNNSDYLIPGNDEAADYFRMSSKFEDFKLENADFRQGFRCNYYLNEWRGLWDGSHTADFTTGIKEKYPTEVLMIAGTSKRLGVNYQSTYHAPYFNLYEDAVYVLDRADHYETIRSPLLLPKIRYYFKH